MLKQLHPRITRKKNTRRYRSEHKALHANKECRHVLHFTLAYLEPLCQRLVAYVKRANEPIAITTTSRQSQKVSILAIRCFGTISFETLKKQGRVDPLPDVRSMCVSLPAATLTDNVVLRLNGWRRKIPEHERQRNGFIVVAVIVLLLLFLSRAFFLYSQNKRMGDGINSADNKIEIAGKV